MTSAEKLPDDYWQSQPAPLLVVPDTMEKTEVGDRLPTYTLERAGKPVPAPLPAYAVALDIDNLAQTLAESARTRVTYDRVTDLLYRHRYPSF